MAPSQPDGTAHRTDIRHYCARAGATVDVSANYAARGGAQHNSDPPVPALSPSGASAHSDGIRAHSAARYFRLPRLVADLEKHSEAYTALREACYSANPRTASAAAHALECTNMTASRSRIAM